MKIDKLLSSVNCNLMVHIISGTNTIYYGKIKEMSVELLNRLNHYELIGVHYNLASNVYMIYVKPF